MPIEIERKFLVVSDDWKRGVIGTREIRQAYLTKNGRLSVRVRIDGTERAMLTIKTVETGIERHEYEYSIPVTDAEQLLLRREGAVITKARHLVPCGDLTWEVDVFEGENTGLIIAEIELARRDQPFERPEWIGKEVTDDRRYYNADLAKLAYTHW